MLARYMLLYLSVCVSQSDRASKRLNGSSCFLACKLFLHLSYAVLQGNSGISTNKRTSH